ncbi:MAG: 16S rRNA (adenine(1518)-N(6)/adenine(1519)-N(6))-dimethyltransferase RsmA [Proteobacteria bacterium]|uniref:16S rRNA (adenine(1518)-N(6)/adenine(1519)-N(6))- dimethyltransferase RsmA n=1 Tax=Rudaea sp. TaxID=2136325 RepID=UPI001DAD2B8A|nr:16S rRNA (adenine(1518)-N(6)/adenine(1519)-N(6))-dimethyltransferase RsmA [Pseudomonadota bacterium]MBS0567094.1 16S rRNA (adenine(1518)-N(6)/adenine(1519)-N(6))-dimethyltransferase RsmA [Pseudomonadota bacterium]
MSDFAPHVTKKRFGQHFLHDKNILRRIVEYVAPRPGEHIVEIGPGEGALTLPLLRAAGSLTVIELDRDLIEPLRARANSVGKLAIVHRDVLEVDIAALAAGGGIRLVGNLPYNISTPILFHCLDHAAAIRDMHFMLQKEVVERMAAGPGSKTYGRLSVMLQLRCTVESLFDVPPTAFSPPPKVDSAVVRLVPLPADKLAQADSDVIERVVRTAFGQRRKTLGNALRGVADTGDLAAAAIDPRARAEQLPPSAFVALARHLQNKG